MVRGVLKLTRLLIGTLPASRLDNPRLLLVFFRADGVLNAALPECDERGSMQVARGRFCSLGEWVVLDVAAETNVSGRQRVARITVAVEDLSCEGNYASLERRGK